LAIDDRPSLGDAILLHFVELLRRQKIGKAGRVPIRESRYYVVKKRVERTGEVLLAQIARSAHEPG
jgi:hypothetical protein